MKLAPRNERGERKIPLFENPDGTYGPLPTKKQYYTRTAVLLLCYLVYYFLVYVIYRYLDWKLLAMMLGLIGFLLEPTSPELFWSYKRWLSTIMTEEEFEAWQQRLREEEGRGSSPHDGAE